MELSEGGGRIEDWESNNTARLHESHSQKHIYKRAHLKYVCS